jgi:NADH-quinone oxidoreductase subunit E
MFVALGMYIISAINAPAQTNHAHDDHDNHGESHHDDQSHECEESHDTVATDEPQSFSSEVETVDEIAEETPETEAETVEAVTETPVADETPTEEVVETVPETPAEEVTQEKVVAEAQTVEAVTDTPLVDETPPVETAQEEIAEETKVMEIAEETTEEVAQEETAQEAETVVEAQESVEEAVIEAPEVVAPTTARVILDGPRNGQKDNLTLIKGVGLKLEEKLNGLGIYHFDQIAAWTQEDIDWVDDSLSFSGRIKRDDWVTQSKVLAAGEATEFSQRAAKGEVASSRK